MDKSDSATAPPSLTRNDTVASAKQFVKELKVCTLDPATYLQRCLAVSKGRSGLYTAPNASKTINGIVPPAALSNISISKNSFLTEKPDYGMITNIITSRAPGNYYNTRVRPNYQILTPRVYTNNYLTNPTGAAGADNKSVTLENPKKLLLQMLKSAVISAKKQHAAYLKSKKGKRKKKKHLKTKRSISHRSGYFSKDRNHHGTKSKGVAKAKLTNVLNQNNPSKNSNMVNKMLEETEEMLKITFLSNINSFSDASATPVTDIHLQEKSDMSQIITNFITKILGFANGMNTDENNQQPGNAFISTTLTRKSKESVKKVPTNTQSHVSTTSKRKGSSTVNVQKAVSGRDNSLQGKPKIRNRKDRMPCIGFGRAGKDDTEDAELAHCTIQPDPPSAISAPYRERNSVKSPPPKEPETTKKRDVMDEKKSYGSNYLQRFREPNLDNSSRTKLLPQKYNSQITYACPSRELILKGNEAQGAVDSDHKIGEVLSTESGNVLGASDTSVKMFVVDNKSKSIQCVEKKTSVKANISRGIGRMTTKSFVETRSLQQRNNPDAINKLANSVVQTRKLPALRCNNKPMLQNHSEGKLYNNSKMKTDTNPHATSNFISGGSKYTSGSSRHRQQRRFPLPGKDVRSHAIAIAERRFFNRNEHLLFLARPNTRCVEDTKQRYGEVLDQYHVRNLNSIIFCNQAEDSRLKKKKNDLLVEELIQDALKNEVSGRIFEESPRAPNVSEASSSTASGSDHSFCTDSDPILNLAEDEHIEDIPIGEVRRKLSVIQEEPEDIEHVDTFYMTIANSLDNYLNVSSLLLDSNKVACSEANAQEDNKIGATAIELDYKVSDRFQREDRVNGIENQDSLLVLRNPEIASQESDCPGQSTCRFSMNSDISIPLRLYKSMDSIAPNISKFITVFEGMELTLKGMKENCHFGTTCSSNFITQDEIEKDCTRALFRAKEANSCSQKFSGVSNSVHVMRCEHFVTNSSLDLATGNMCNSFLYTLFSKSEKYTLSDTEEKNDIPNKPITVNPEKDTPIAINNLEYYSAVIETNHSKYLRELINDPNVLKAIGNILNDSIDYAVSTISMNKSGCSSVKDNIKSLPLLNVTEAVEDKDILLCIGNKSTKSTTSKKQNVIDTNRKFGLEEGHIVCQSIEGMDCTPWPFIFTVTFPIENAGIEPHGTEMDQEHKSINCLATLQSSECAHTIKKCTQVVKKDISEDRKTGNGTRSASFFTETSIVEATHRLSKKPTTPILTSDISSKFTQTDIAIGPKIILPVRENIEIGDVSLDRTSSRRNNRLSKTIKIAFLLLAICAAGLIPTMPSTKPAVEKLINSIISTLAMYKP